MQTTAPASTLSVSARKCPADVASLKKSLGAEPCQWRKKAVYGASCGAAREEAALGEVAAHALGVAEGLSCEAGSVNATAAGPQRHDVERHAEAEAHRCESTVLAERVLHPLASLALGRVRRHHVVCGRSCTARGASSRRWHHRGTMASGGGRREGLGLDGVVTGWRKTPRRAFGSRKRRTPVMVPK